jgi:hypothetical protein
MTLAPGVYKFSSSAQLTGALTLDFTSNSNGAFMFQIGSTLTTASASAVSVLGVPGSGSTVYWDVGSSATLRLACRKVRLTRKGEGERRSIAFARTNHFGRTNPIYPMTSMAHRFGAMNSRANFD